MLDESIRKLNETIEETKKITNKKKKTPLYHPRQRKKNTRKMLKENEDEIQKNYIKIKENGVKN